MAVINDRQAPITERYEGETLALLRKVSGDLDYIRNALRVLDPVLAAMQTGGVLAAKRAWGRMGGRT